MATRCDIRVESLADHPELLEQVGLLRWKEWAYGAQDATPFIEVTAREAGRRGQLPITLVAVDVAGGDRPRSGGVLSVLRLGGRRAPTAGVDGDPHDHPGQADRAILGR
jgi:hypothetical protein